MPISSWYHTCETQPGRRESGVLLRPGIVGRRGASSMINDYDTRHHEYPTPPPYQKDMEHIFEPFTAKTMMLGYRYFRRCEQCSVLAGTRGQWSFGQGKQGKETIARWARSTPHAPLQGWATIASRPHNSPTPPVQLPVNPRRLKQITIAPSQSSVVFCVTLPK